MIRALRSTWRRLLGSFFGRSSEGDLSDEIDSHIRLLAEEDMRRGLSPEEAFRHARLQFGSVESTKESYRDQRGLPVLDIFVQDFRYAFRMLSRNPGFTIVALFSLALGIGANTTVFSVINTVLLHPLPYSDPDRLALVQHRSLRPQGGLIGNFELTPAGYLDLRRVNKSFDSIAAFASLDLNLTGSGEPERLTGEVVSPALFSLLNVSPMIGRGFTDADERDGAPRVTILSHQLWQRRFGGQQDVIGQTVTLDNQKYDVVGVAPPGFDFPKKGTDLWTPKVFTANDVNDRRSYYLGVIARLKAGVTLQQVKSELDVIAHDQAQAFPESNTNLGLSAAPLSETVVQGFQQALIVLQVAVAFVLLIACVNVANLLLARSAVREKEMAARAALGAGGRRLVRQLLTESLLLSFFGGALGLLLAAWGIGALKLMNPGTIPRLDEVSLNGNVLGFTLGISSLAGLIFGLAPALQAATPNLQHALKEGGRGFTGGGRRQLRGLLVTAEVALSLVLLAGAGLLIRSFLQLQSVNPGFTPKNVLTLRLEIANDKAKDLTGMANFYQGVIERVQALPGVQVAGVATALPVITPGIRSAFAIDGKPEPPPGQPPMLANNRVVSSGYFSALGIPLVNGRFLSNQDTAQAPLAAVINQSMAKRYWAEENPVGKRFRLLARTGVLPLLNVVGVVGDIRQAGLDTDPLPEFYTPLTQDHVRFARPRVLLVRTTGNPLSLAGAVKSEIWAVDKNQPVFAVQTMEQILTTWMAPRRFNLLLMAAFAMVALALAAVGIYGVMSYAASQRTREIGLRIALGAQRHDVFRLIVGRGLVLVLGGVGIGLIASFALTRWLASLLFGISATDPLTFGSVAVLLTFVALVACYFPARRAMKMDPTVALRYQ